MTKPKTPINWLTVFEAAKRGKLGRAQHGDHELCAAAFKADPTKYGEVHARARDGAIAEAFPFVPIEVTEQDIDQQPDPHAAIAAKAFGKPE